MNTLILTNVWKRNQKEWVKSLDFTSFLMTCLLTTLPLIAYWLSNTKRDKDKLQLMLFVDQQRKAQRRVTETGASF